MEITVPPRDYLKWRTDENGRCEDAAYLFGYYLIEHCRDEAMSTLPKTASAKVEAAVETAVDTALHNVCDMLEGFFPLPAGRSHAISLALNVQVRNRKGDVIETQELSPSKLDLPIGYWKWAKEREFR
jgi:hypothetical protein